MENKFRCIAKTFKGLEDILAREVQEIGGQEVEVLNRGVMFSADKKLLYEANHNLRTALMILKEIKTFRIKNQDDFYNQIKKINWPTLFPINKTISINAVVNSPIFEHSGFVALKTKDAVADCFRYKTGKRPDIDKDNPDVKINVHISNNNCTISLDSSGIPLFKRGYKTGIVDAPINEVLAAGLIKMADWNINAPFIDPMCGSGTIAIEAALIKYGIPPGNFRKEYSFMNWYDFDNELYTQVANNKSISIENDKTIFASDISPFAIDITKQNIKNAGLQQVIEVKNINISELKPALPSGILIFNPPYGERMKPDEINELYKSIGDALKNNFEGYDAHLITSNLEAIKHIGLKHSWKKDLNNGGLDCKFLKFSLYKGTKKTYKYQNKQ